MDNIYITLGLFAVIMVGNYLVTTHTLDVKKTEFEKHYEMKSYKTSPEFKKLEQFKKKPLKTFILYGALLVIFYLYDRLVQSDPSLFIRVLYEGLQGFFLGIFGYATLQALNSLLIYWILGKKPKIMEGKITQSPLALYVFGAFHNMVTSGLLVLLFIFIPTPLLGGFLLGTLTLGLKYLVGVKKYWNATL